MSAELQKLKGIIRQSAFYRSPNYSVNIRFRDLFKDDGSLMAYNDRVKELHEKSQLLPHQIISEMTPEFQRDNTAWTQAMQRKYVENILCGCKSEIQLYDIKHRGSELGDSLILDGLQRLSAICAYQSGEFSIFDGIKWADISTGGIFPRINLILQIFTFDTDVEACRFYIQMNKGITHSESDLETAYEFMRRHGEEL